MITAAKSAANASAARDLLAWYDEHARTMPWRIGPHETKAGRRPDPYHIWLCEVMAQQTQLGTVVDYFEKFTARWPNFEALAAADTDEVLAAWAGLGYYSRARNLKRCAEIVAFEFEGRLPDDVDALRALPGIGEYTSAAIAAIAFDERVPVVDGNVERVIARLHAIGEPLPGARARIREYVADMLDPARPGDFAQAVMDLGATVCRPKAPMCLICPIRAACAAFKRGDPEAFPVKRAKKPKPTRRGAAFVAVNARGEIFLRRRPEKGMLGGMMEPPTSDWSARVDGETGTAAAPFQAAWRAAGEVRHTFTHFHLELLVHAGRVAGDKAGDGKWVARANLAGAGLPTVMKKVVEAALPGTFPDQAKASK